MSTPFEIVLLGTSSPLPSADRSGAGQVVIAGDAAVLVDCGWGAARRLLQAGVPAAKLAAVCFTHLHSDHISDFADLLTLAWTGGRTEPLPVYGPAGTREVVEGFRAALAPDRRYRLAHHGEKLHQRGASCEVHQVEAGEEPVPVAVFGAVRVSAFAVDHRPVMPAFGYRFECEGRAIVISGDTLDCPGLRRGAQEADLLICDAQNRAMMQALVERLRGAGQVTAAALLADTPSYHASTEDAARIAEAAAVKHLVLSHLTPPVPNEGPLVDAFTAGLGAIYHGTLTVGRDLQRFAL